MAIAARTMADFIPLTVTSKAAAVPPEDFVSRAPALADRDGDGDDDDDGGLREPWRCAASHLAGLSITEVLHEELVRFCEFISPTPAEHAARDGLIDRFHQLAAELFPGAEVVVFGSVATRLYLPVSDLDLVIFYETSDPKLCLRVLAEQLQARNLVAYIELILTARVPIVKFKDAQTGISVDVCMNVENGRAACALINEFQLAIPALRPLTLFLKYFLHCRDMNDTYTGGVGSFLLQMMIVSQLQLHPYGSMRLPASATASAPASRDLNLGALLLSFLEVFGKTFNYAVVGISVRDGGSYFSKAQRGAAFTDVMRPYLLSVENPLEPDVDVGRNSFGIMRVRRAFSWAFDRLTLEFPDEPCRTLLGRLVPVRGEVFRARGLGGTPPLSLTGSGSDDGAQRRDRKSQRRPPRTSSAKDAARGEHAPKRRKHQRRAA
ncbi:unnamed protein product (mitochondrion) [Plasmodiophora brassicae]|uniref:Uncharacterized protein n=1 Tax=Plasmodiophora brassicae TaxID=37360 RepID=A0A0G4J094_PLABS|nr:hypothetical protein PBRA_008317 [Plasmodiophora brassicae]SPQ95283.1 unnamed protein product [Plasmodiophora brassicae]